MSRLPGDVQLMMGVSRALYERYEVGRLPMLYQWMRI